MLQQLPNLTKDDIKHGYQTCALVDFFFQGQVLEHQTTYPTVFESAGSIFGSTYPLRVGLIHPS